MKVELNLDEKDVTVWRYLTLEKFLDLVAYNEPKLFLCRIDKLHDKYEKSFNINQMMYLNSIGQSNKMKELQESYREKIFINSWNISENELHSLWETYVGAHKYGVAIKSTPKKIKESIDAIPSNWRRDEVLFIDKVHYQTNFTNEINTHSFALKKEHFYTTEDEMRIYMESSHEKIVIPLDLNLLIDEVVISPFISEYAQKHFKTLIYNYTKEFEITMNRIRCSQILFD